jgi:DnaJ-class molecular chaperone
MNDSFVNHYAMLGVGTTASQEEIDWAYAAARDKMAQVERKFSTRSANAMESLSPEAKEAAFQRQRSANLQQLAESYRVKSHSAVPLPDFNQATYVPAETIESSQEYLRHHARKLIQIEKSYRVLSDPAARAEYDVEYDAYFNQIWQASWLSPSLKAMDTANTPSIGKVPSWVLIFLLGVFVGLAIAAGIILIV